MCFFIRERKKLWNLLVVLVWFGLVGGFYKYSGSETYSDKTHIQFFH